MAVSNCRTFISIPVLILAQLVVFLRKIAFLDVSRADSVLTRFLNALVALAMIRNIQKLSGTALVADAFILFGLVYIFSNEIGVILDHGIANVELFNSKDFPLLIGSVLTCLLRSLTE